jgi:hypothetical protein
MAETASTLPVLRFKFMPNPLKAGLHLGHAWLLFVMQALRENLQQHGRAVELVLVMDDLLSRRGGNLSEEEWQSGKDTIRDMELLGTPPDRMVWSGDPQFVESFQQQIHSICLEKWHSGLTCANMPYYFLHNAALDVHLGITHIIRGDDRLEYTELYEECYRKLGGGTPALYYIPVVCQANGKKIDSGSAPHLVRTLLLNNSAEELLCLLVGQCMRHDREADWPCDHSTAMRLLLGDDQPWLTTLDPKDEIGRSRFFERFVHGRQIDIEERRCVAVR